MAGAGGSGSEGRDVGLWAIQGLGGRDRSQDFILTGVDGLKQSEVILVMENWLWWNPGNQVGGC